MSETILRAQGVTKTVRDGAREVLLLDGVSLALGPGEKVVLLGPSGSGKSSLLNILGALDADYRGEVELDGERLAGLSDARLAALRNRTVGFVFQAYNLLGHLSVLDNVLLPAHVSGERPDAARARAVLERVGLGGAAHRLPATLSGGERQRVAIARALYQRPKLLLCDEPTGNLDADTGAHVLRLFDELARDGVALLMATHDPLIAERADRVLRLRGGRLA